ISQLNRLLSTVRYQIPPPCKLRDPHFMTYHHQLMPEAPLPLAHRIHSPHLSAHPSFEYHIHSPNP
ncbi:hypothetical protein BGX38DRAFT_1215659, partial [Terfezia claveryi]